MVLAPCNTLLLHGLCHSRAPSRNGQRVACGARRHRLRSALHRGPLVAWTGHVYRRRQAIDGAKAKHQGHGGRVFFAIFGGVGTVAAIALAGAAPHRVESHAGTAHPAVAKRQNTQTGIAVQRQAQAACAVDQVGTNRAPGVPAIGGKLPGSHLRIQLFNHHARIQGQVGAVALQNLGDAVAPYPAPSALKRSHSPLGMAGLKVLAIDDDEAVRMGMQSLLQSWGCECLTAESGADAMQSLQRMTPELIITDFRLRHEETGKQVLQALRSTLGSMVPAIIMTGDTSPQRLRDAQSTSALLLHKPVSTGQLRDAITLLLQQAPAAWSPEDHTTAVEP